MGKLKGKRIYLGGPVESLDDAHNWRDQITPKLTKLGLIVLNPLIKPSWMPKVDGKHQREMRETLNLGGYLTANDEHNNDLTRQWCLSMVRISDILIFNLSGNNRTYGTYEELSNASQKPVFLLFDDIHLPSMWLASQLGLNCGRNIAFYVHDAISSIIQRLRDVDKNGSSDFDLENKLKWAFLTEWVNNPKGD